MTHTKKAVRLMDLALPLAVVSAGAGLIFSAFSEKRLENRVAELEKRFSSPVNERGSYGRKT